jgi:hypothetical protein
LWVSTDTAFSTPGMSPLNFLPSQSARTSSSSSPTQQFISTFQSGSQLAFCVTHLSEPYQTFRE